MNVPHLEARALTRQATRPKRGQTTLVRHLGQRVGLVHELRQLAGPEERLDHRGYGPSVDQIVDVDLLGIRVDRHPLLDQTRHTAEADAELVRDELTHGPHPTVTEMIDVVRVPTALVEFDEVSDDGDEIVLREDGLRPRDIDLEALIDLVATDTAEIVALWVEEDPLEGLTGGLNIRGIAGAEQ